MTFIIENTHLNINEEDVRRCEDLNELRYWEEEISKQIIVMDSKLRNFEMEELSLIKDKKNISKTIHAKELQLLLLKIIEHRIEKVKEEVKNSMEALYFTYAEQDLDPNIHDKLLKKANKAMKGTL